MPSNAGEVTGRQGRSRRPARLGIGSLLFGAPRFNPPRGGGLSASPRPTRSGFFSSEQGGPVITRRASTSLSRCRRRRHSSQKPNPPAQKGALAQGHRCRIVAAAARAATRLLFLVSWSRAAKGSIGQDHSVRGCGQGRPRSWQRQRNSRTSGGSDQRRLRSWNGLPTGGQLKPARDANIDKCEQSPLRYVAVRHLTRTSTPSSAASLQALPQHTRRAQVRG